MRALVVLVALAAPHLAAAAPPELAACATTVTHGTAAPTTLAQLPAETAVGAGVRARFTLLDAKARVAEEAALGAWAAEIHVDATGMATDLSVTLPGARTPAQALPDVLAFVRAHACLFGISDPAAISAHVYIDRGIFIDRAPVALGAIEVTVTPAPGTTTFDVRGHLWPIALAPTEATDAPPRALARYLGRAITQDWEDLSKEGFGNHRTLHVQTSARTFRTEVGPALICRKGVLDVHTAAYVELLGKPDPADRRLAELPTVVALDDGQPFGAAWIFPPRVAAADDYAPADRANAAGATCLGVKPP